MWGLEIPGPKLEKILLLNGLSVVTILLLSYLSVLGKRNTRNLREITRLNDSILRINNVNLHLQEYLVYIEEKNELELRKQLSREIHDSIGYLLTNVAILMEAGINIPGKKDPKITEILKVVRNHVKEGLEDLRNVLRSWRNKNVAHLNFGSSLMKLVEAFDCTHINISINWGDLPLQFGEENENILLRCIQEGITNSLRHGRASQITISFRKDGPNLVSHIEDNGLGVSKIEEGIGLAGMQERLNSIGGLVNTHNITDGFLLTVTLPQDYKG